MAMSPSTDKDAKPPPITLSEVRFAAFEPKDADRLAAFHALIRDSIADTRNFEARDQAFFVAHTGDKGWTHGLLLHDEIIAVNVIVRDIEDYRRHWVCPFEETLFRRPIAWCTGFGIHPKYQHGEARPLTSMTRVA